MIFEKAESNTMLGFVELDMTINDNNNKDYDRINTKLKRYLQDIIEENGINYSGGIRVVGIIINHINISARVLSCKKGPVCLVSSSEWLEMPTEVHKIPTHLPLALRLVHNCAQIMNQTCEIIMIAHSAVQHNREYFSPCLEPYAENY